MTKVVLSATLLILISMTSSSLLKPRNSARCPHKWVVFENSCYRIILDSYTWYEAQAICETVGGYLINIGSYQEEKILDRWETTVWIGLNDLVHEGSFVWVHSQQNATYTNWAKKEPNNYEGKEDCVVAAFPLIHKWLDAKCMARFAAICEKTSRDIGRCPDTWVVFENSCYKLIRDNQKWNDAQATCKTLDSSLVNIGSKEEDQFVVRLALNYEVTVWIGLTDIVQEGHFVWADTQEEPIYEHWLSGEPNNDYATEDCATLWYIHGGKWNDRDCDTELSAVCEKPSDD